MAEGAPAVALRDSTLREGMDVPGVWFDVAARIEIAAELARAGVPEAEVIAPSRVREDARAAREVRSQVGALRLSALVYAAESSWQSDAEDAAGAVDRIDLLMPLSAQREPRAFAAKAMRLEETIAWACSLPVEVGAGLPHATQADRSAVAELARRAASAGARRVTLYDTNGSGDPFAVRDLVGEVVTALDVPVFFHGHDDLGLATANGWAAVLAGASGLDVTVNGLGDRAGNASLEQLVALLGLKGVATEVDPSALPRLSALVEELSGVPVSRLAPIVGRHAFEHLSPAHLSEPAQFEALDPSSVGRERSINDGVAAGAGEPRK